MNMQLESGFDDPTLLPWRPLEPGEIIEKGDEFYNDYERKWNEILSFIGDEYIVKEWNTPLRTRRKPVQGEALTLSIGGVRPAGKQPEPALAQKLKAALPCPWNHQPMWVINGDWDNPNVKCSVPSCPAYKQDVTLEQWNNRDGVPEPAPAPKQAQSAREWVAAFLDAYQAHYNVLRPLIKRYVEKLEQLAARCDAAEVSLRHWLQNAQKHAVEMSQAEAMISVYKMQCDDLKAELAQARAELAALKAAIEHMANMPEYDQDDAHRLRFQARAAINSTTPQPQPQPLDRPGWLPIETAPKDGTRIVTAEESNKGFWFNEDWWIDDETEWQYATDPIAWMPLPATPHSTLTTPNIVPTKATVRKFRSAVSGLWYENAHAAGDIDAVEINGQRLEKRIGEATMSWIRRLGEWAEQVYNNTLPYSQSKQDNN
jgi:hypothetical protein